MTRKLFRAIGRMTFFLILSVAQLNAQWTSAHPGMEWNSVMTGRTNGHIADLWLTNTTNQPQTVTVGPFYIPGPGQPYVTDGPHTISVPPNTTKVFPLDGSCTDRSKKPPKEGASSNPKTWLPPADVSLPEPGAPMSTADGWEPGEDLENLVVIPKYPGYETAFPYVIDKISKRPEQVAPLLLETSRLLTMTYDDLEIEGKIQTPVSLDFEKEKRVLTQLGIWQYSAALKGETYLLQDYQADAEREYKDLTGLKVQSLPADEQKAFRDGIEDIWNASIDLGEAALTINRPSTYYSLGDKQCRCDSLILDAALTANDTDDSSENTTASWKERLDFGTKSTLKNDTVFSNYIFVDPENIWDIAGTMKLVTGDNPLEVEELGDIADEVMDEKELRKRVKKLKEKLKEYLIKKHGETAGTKQWEKAFEKLFFFDQKTNFYLSFRNLELKCRCSQLDPVTKKFEPCDLIYGNRSVIGYPDGREDITPSHKNKLTVKVWLQKYTAENAGKLKKAGSRILRTGQVPNGDDIQHGSDSEGVAYRSIQIPLKLKGKGAHEATSGVLVRATISAFCSDEDCGGKKKFTECKKMLYVWFEGISN
jgi:hypothetical protein